MTNRKAIHQTSIKQSILLLFVGVFLACCQQGGKEESTATTTNGLKNKKRATGLNHQRVPQGLLTLAEQEQEALVSKDNRPKENLYGKFFDGRAEFYIIKEPQNKLYHSKVNSLTLYYLDGQLSQTRYTLEQDIIEDLLKKYGSFGITGHDPKNQALIRSRQIMIHTADGLQFNKELDNYQINWQIEERQIRYRVNKHGAENRFNYVERIKTYKKTFNEIERAGI